MQTRRDYLVSKGLAKPGRGRLSAAAHNAINEAIASGIKFSDMPSGDKVKSEDAAKREDTDNFSPTPEPFHSGGWYYLNPAGKKVSVGGRNVCGKCHYSLDYQNCENPTALNDSGEFVPVMR